MTENQFRSHFSPFQINMQPLFFSSAVPSGSGTFQMPTRPSSSAASTLRGGGGEGPISETLK